MSKQNFILVAGKFGKQAVPITDAELAALINSGEVKRVRPRLYEKVSRIDPKDVTNSYETKVMLPDTKRGRGRPRKVMP